MFPHRSINMLSEFDKDIEQKGLQAFCMDASDTGRCLCLGAQQRFAQKKKRFMNELEQEKAGPEKKHSVTKRIQNA